MKKILLCITALALLGCSDKTLTEQVVEQLNVACPGICHKSNEVWTGLVKPEPKTLKCVCEGR